ncbi:hypothetical protein DAEQUDRAFT_739820 [Daedalea quercina L-15889]|uniref:Uncharacterized protein n=1 Tax=Daedalea quercina L-15889 TaxID=1314783 RepID=A0A165N974_9APHY|nr:hypothetical protein DAEQUDRAFT_739820 [Daedalea quercina L-15889]
MPVIMVPIHPPSPIARSRRGNKGEGNDPHASTSTSGAQPTKTGRIEWSAKQYWVRTDRLLDFLERNPDKRRKLFGDWEQEAQQQSRSLHRQYMEVQARRNQTGAGLTDADRARGITTFKDLIHEHFPQRWEHRLDIIWGNRPSVRVTPQSSQPSQDLGTQALELFNMPHQLRSTPPPHMDDSSNRSQGVDAGGDGRDGNDHTSAGHIVQAHPQPQLMYNAHSPQVVYTQPSPLVGYVRPQSTPIVYMQPQPQVYAQQPAGGYAQQPITSAYAQQPATSVYAQQPTTSMYAQQPATGVYAQQPTTGVYAQQLATGTYAQQPATGAYTQQPATSTYAQQPATGAYAQQPTAGVYTQQPATGGYTQQPSTGGYTQQPPTGGYAQHLPTGSYAQQPPTGTYAQQSSANTYAQQPSTGSHAQQPSVDTYAQQSSPDVYAQQPAGGGSEPSNWLQDLLQDPSDGRQGSPSAGDSTSLFSDTGSHLPDNDVISLQSAQPTISSASSSITSLNKNMGSFSISPLATTSSTTARSKRTSVKRVAHTDHLVQPSVTAKRSRTSLGAVKALSTPNLGDMTKVVESKMHDELAYAHEIRLKQEERLTIEAERKKFAEQRVGLEVLERIVNRCFDHNIDPRTLCASFGMDKSHMPPQASGNVVIPLNAPPLIGDLHAASNAPPPIIRDPHVISNTPPPIVGNNGAVPPVVSDPRTGLNAPPPFVGDPRTGLNAPPPFVGDPRTGSNAPPPFIGDPRTGLNAPPPFVGNICATSNAPPPFVGDVHSSASNAPPPLVSDVRTMLNTPPSFIGNVRAMSNAPLPQVTSVMRQTLRGPSLGIRVPRQMLPSVMWWHGQKV